jgi:23S rRNA pseudouridine1911/1915/1917 synthase
MRIDIWLAKKTEGLSRSRIQKLIGSGAVYVNEKQEVSVSFKLKPGDRVITTYVPTQTSDHAAAVKEEIKLIVLYEDQHIIAVDKPKGMTVHPAAGVRSGTLVNALLWHCEHSLSDIGGALRPGIVHRLDKDTSGVIVAAKTNKAHLALSKAFSERGVIKEYNTIVCGNIKNDFGKIDLPIGRDPNNRKKMAVVSRGGRQALTLFEVLERFGSHTWLKIDLKTGRTHQIRVHMAYIGYPVAGDGVYGSSGRKQHWDCGQILHSSAIEFDHPVTGERLRIESPLPEYFKAAVQALLH